MTPFDRLLKERHVFIDSDNPFQARARLLQATWREEMKRPIGHRPQRDGASSLPLGSRLQNTGGEAKIEGWNYLTPRIFEVVKAEVRLGRADSENVKLFGEPRIWVDLLSSQPLCFNLFAEFVGREQLLTPVLRALGVTDCAEVTRLEFEFSPGRGKEEYGGDRSAFDVLIEYRRPAGDFGFVAIEVKYHEAMTERPGAAGERKSWSTQAQESELFKPGEERAAERAPTHQMWRDHRLAQLYARHGDPKRRDVHFGAWRFAFVYPKGNARCAGAVDAYSKCLADNSTFSPWTLEQVVDAIESACAEPWVRELRSRYLGWHRLAALGVEPAGAW